MPVTLPAVIAHFLTLSFNTTLVPLLPSIALGVAITYGFGLIPKVQTLLAAEAGRKKDLVRRVQVQGFDFDVAILLPFLDEADYPALVDCLTCLAAQQYPLQKMKWVILAGKEVQPYETMVQTLVEKATRSTQTDTLPLIWLPIPALVEATQTVLAWGTKNIPNQVTAQLVVFLQPTDLVKPDFVNQLTVKAYSHEVVQGYVASKEVGAGWLHQLLGIETRIASRIETAGRFHAKKPLLLRSSGFAIKTTLLEQLPWPAVAGQQASWLYSLALARYQIPIAWAPTVVVYTRIMATLPQVVGKTWQTMGIVTSLAIQSLTLAFKRPVISWVTALELASFWCTLPETLLLGMGISLALAGATFSQPTTQWMGTIIATGVVLFQLGVFRVSRLSWKESLTYSIFKPCLLVIMVLALPVMLVKRLALTIGWIVASTAIFISSRLKHRFPFTKPQVAVAPNQPVESLLHQPSLIEPTKPTNTTATPYWLVSNVEENALPLSATTALSVPSIQQEPAVSSSSINVAPLEALWHQTVGQFDTIETQYAVTLLFGTKSVQAMIDVRYTPQQGIQLTLQYKTQSFKTALYPLFSQAFYELQAKLSQYNIQINSCGGCAYYYQPALALQVQQGKQVGLCLKQVEQQLLGKPNITPTTVLSTACEHHTPLEQRMNILTSISQQLTTNV
jgi:hypothetical protein